MKRHNCWVDQLVTKKLIIISIVILILTLPVMILLSEPLFGSWESEWKKCQETTKPELRLPNFGVFEGIPYTIAVCGVDPNHTYQLWENKFDTFFRTFSGQTSYTFIISWSEFDFHADTTLGIELWDNTTKEVIDQKILILLDVRTFLT